MLPRCHLYRADSSCHIFQLPPPPTSTVQYINPLPPKHHSVVEATYLHYSVVDLKTLFLVRRTFLDDLGYKDPLTRSAVVVVLRNKLQLLSGR